MIGLDTNVLVRLIVRDDPPEEFERAQAFIAGAAEPFFVPDVVLAELVWVLQRRYRRSRHEVGEAIAGLVESRGVVFESMERVRTALERFRQGRGGFADYLLAERAREAGCSFVATFDRVMLGEDGFRAP